ncbi:MAG: hypothetical protein ACJZ8K_04245 [Paracoccaceae bacterium]|jgi:hypothetical protein|tara:strand:- start:816 stop:1157 length:342 start_codon:yes stop_codon:yes gene_type:complete
MFAVIYQFKFPGVSEAKVAAGFCSESLGGKIAEYDFLGLNILISKDGDLNIHVKFEDAKALKKFEEDSEKLLGDLRNSFVFKENKVSGVFAFTYEKEAVATDIKIEGASVVRN